jgi:hypothetical protein
MPHFIVECTENIRQEARLPELFASVNTTLAATGIFPLGGIRSRAHWIDTWQMADGKHDYAFVHLTVTHRRSLRGRSRTGGLHWNCPDNPRTNHQQRGNKPQSTVKAAGQIFQPADHKRT